MLNILLKNVSKLLPTKIGQNITYSKERSHADASPRGKNCRKTGAMRARCINNTPRQKPVQAMGNTTVANVALTIEQKINLQMDITIAIA